MILLILKIKYFLIIHMNHASGLKEFQGKLTLPFTCVNFLGNSTFIEQSNLTYFKLFQILHQIHDFGFRNLHDHKLNDKQNIWHKDYLDALKGNLQK